MNAWEADTEPTELEQLRLQVHFLIGLLAPLADLSQDPEPTVIGGDTFYGVAPLGEYTTILCLREEDAQALERLRLAREIVGPFVGEPEW